MGISSPKARVRGATAVIRKAIVQDAQEIARIHVASWKTTYPGIVPQSYIDSLDAASLAGSWQTRLEKAEMHIFVAENEGGLCGFVSGGPLREPIQAFDAEIYAIYLLHAAQGQGAGKLLMQRLAETLRMDGHLQAAVWILAENPSRGFYEHLGGSQIAQKTIQIGDANLLEVAYGWNDLRTLTDLVRSAPDAPPTA